MPAHGRRLYGKESQSAAFACVASIAALRLGHPVKLRVDRDDDFLITGRATLSTTAGTWALTTTAASWLPRLT